METKQINFQFLKGIMANNLLLPSLMLKNGDKETCEWVLCKQPKADSAVKLILRPSDQFL